MGQRAKPVTIIVRDAVWSVCFFSPLCSSSLRCMDPHNCAFLACSAFFSYSIFLTDLSRKRDRMSLSYQASPHRTRVISAYRYSSPIVLSDCTPPPFPHTFQTGITPLKMKNPSCIHQKKVP